MKMLVGVLGAIALVAFIVWLNLEARRLDRERKKRGEPEPDLEIDIW